MNKRILTLLAITAITLTAAPMAYAQQPAPATSAVSGQTALLVGSDSLVGSTVRNADGYDIGKVSRLMIDPGDGRIATVIIATGGTMGVGSNTISIPWSSVKVGQDRGRVIVTASQMLETAPKPERAKEATPASNAAEAPRKP